MDWKALFKAQDELDKHILQEKGLEGQDLLDEKILALLVELGELAQEVPSIFKFWKNAEDDKEKALEELVDCLHFFLSIGLELEIDKDYEMDNLCTTISLTGGLLVNFQNVFNLVSGEYFNENDWLETIEYFLGLGALLGFTEDQIEASYWDKNSENHKRQESNY